MTADQPFLTRSEFARLRGCSPAYVTKLGHQGRLVLNAKGLVDVKATAALLDATDDPARGGDRTSADGAGQAARRISALSDSLASSPVEPLTPPAIGDSPAYKNAATRERVAKARLAELELAEKAGSLVRRAEVETAVFSLARQAMDAMDAIADRLSTQLAAESDPARVHALLSAELLRVIQGLAKAKPVPPMPGAAGMPIEATA